MNYRTTPPHAFSREDTGSDLSSFLFSSALVPVDLEIEVGVVAIHFKTSLIVSHFLTQITV